MTFFTSITAIQVNLPKGKLWPVVASVLYGTKPVVTAIVLFAAYRIGSRALKNWLLWTMAALAFLAIFVLHAPFPLIVLAAAVLGAIGGKLAPQKFAVGGGHGAAKNSSGPALNQLEC
jgi:chromate transporter